MASNLADLKKTFLDTPAVQAAVEKGRIRGLMRAGGYVRKTARNSIKRSKKSALPGKPPKSHAGQLKLIFFTWDAHTRSVVVGPIEFRTSRWQSKRAPELLEKGGDVVRRTRLGRTKKYHYRGNPFMDPALKIGRTKFRDALKGSITR